MAACTWQRDLTGTGLGCAVFGYLIAGLVAECWNLSSESSDESLAKCWLVSGGCSERIRRSGLPRWDVYLGFRDAS